MRWLSLTIAVAGVAVWLASCDFGFDGALQEFCTRPGRCPVIDPGGLNGGPDGTATKTAEISQGTQMLPVTVTGSRLAGATLEVDPPGAGTISNEVVEDNQISLRLTLSHGVPVDSPVSLKLVWDTQRFRLTDPFIVTPIVVVAQGGNDVTGDGTRIRPYATLAKASSQSGKGDTIFLKAGTYTSSIFSPPNTSCDNASAGLKPGVTVEGEDAGAVSISSGFPGTCAFNLYSSDQVVQHLTIVGFPEGIRVTNRSDGGTERPRVSDVVIRSCTTGATAMPGASLLLDNVKVETAGDRGLVFDGADVVFQQGSVIDSSKTGVAMLGTGGTLTLDRVVVRRNGAALTTDLRGGAGVLVAADGGVASIVAGSIDSNGHTGITVTGSSNTVRIDGPFISTSMTGGIGIAALAGSAARVYLANSTLNSCPTSIYVEDFGVFNAGTGDGGQGGNTLSTATLHIHDARPGGGGHPPMTFARSTFDGVPPPVGPVSSSNAALRIQIDNPPGNVIDFQ